MLDLMRRAEIAEIVAAIWRASVEPKSWEDVMRRTVRMIPGAVGGAIFTPFHAGPGGFHIAPDAIPEFIEEYLRDNWGAQDPLQHAMFRKFPIERLVWSFEDLLPKEIYLKSPPYRDLVKKYYPHGYDNGVGAIVHGHGARTAVLTVPGSSWDEDEVAEHKMVIRELEPHIYGAIAAHWRLVEAEQAAKVSRFALDQLPLGVIWLGRDGSVVHANAAAQKILDQRDGMFLMAGRLRANAVAQEFDAAIESVGTRQPEASLAVPRRERRPLFVTLVPGAVQDALGSAGDKVCTLVFVTDPDRMPSNVGARLKKLYGLSSAEAAVAELLASGLTIETVAERREVSVHTVKTQIKILMGKMGAGRQSDIVRAVMALGLMPA